MGEALKQAGIPVARRDNPQRQGDSRTLAALRQMSRNTPLRSALAELATEFGDLDWLATEIDAVCGETPDADVGQFFSWRTAVTASEGLDADRYESDAVQLSTFHRAKGLEWTSVAVIGLEAGMVHIAHATRSAALDEERRLLYVAITRAEEELWCSWSRCRKVGKRTWDCEPSPYLAAMNLAAKASQPADPVPFSDRMSELRSKLVITG
jgi:superfamily I DNA/RNA helicase